MSYFIRPLFLSLVIGSSWLAGSESPKADAPRLVSGKPYLDQQRPGLKPQFFAQEILGRGLNERDICISTDGSEIYCGLALGRIVTILVTHLKDGGWTEPEVVSFAADPRFFCMEPCLSPDGKHLYFLSNRPRAGEEPKPGWGINHIWVADRKEDGTWDPPRDPGEPINSHNLSFFPSITRDGTLFFTRTDKVGGKTTLCFSKLVEGAYKEAEELPATVHEKGNPYNAAVSPDGRCLVACVEGRQDTLTPGKPNFYAFFRNREGAWSPGVNLGPEINKPGASAASCHFSPDGKYFFFTLDFRGQMPTSLAGLTSKKLKEMIYPPGNGIYWVDAAYVQKRKPNGF